MLQKKWYQHRNTKYHHIDESKHFTCQLFQTQIQFFILDYNSWKINTKFTVNSWWYKLLLNKYDNSNEVGFVHSYNVVMQTHSFSIRGTGLFLSSYIFISRLYLDLHYMYSRLTISMESCHHGKCIQQSILYWYKHL